MKILAFDGTARAASVALCENDKPLACYTIDNGLTQSELLLPMAENMLRSLKTDFSEVDIYATSVGPGSFTGVRIGVSLIKGLAFGKNAPCVAVSTLEALAENLTPLKGILVPCMDARRNQVYTASFRCDGQRTERLTEDRAISLDALAKELLEFDGSIYLCGDGYSVAKKALTERGVVLTDTPPLLILENAVSVARIAYRKYAKGEFVTDSELSPAYLRLPQAERERLERLEKQQ